MLVTVCTARYNRRTFCHAMHCKIMKIFGITITAFLVLINSSLWAAPKPIPDPPTLEADSYFLMDFDSGRVLAEKDADKLIEPASITKLMTAYLVDKSIADGDMQLEDLVTISEKAWRMKGSKMFVEVGKQISVGPCKQGWRSRQCLALAQGGSKRGRGCQRKS